MNLDLPKLISQFRQPGAIKGLVGVGLAFIGTQLAQDALNDTEERREQAAEELAELVDRIESGHNGVAALIESGDFDAYVMGRAAILGWSPPDVDPLPEPDDQADEDDLPYPGRGDRLESDGLFTCGSCDEPFDTPAALVEHHERNGYKPHGVGAPDLPSRTPGAYLAGVNPSAADMVADAEVPRATADAD